MQKPPAPTLQKNTDDPMAEMAFLQALIGLASICKFSLTKEVIALYDKALSPIGYDSAQRAIEKIFVTRKSNESFPSPSEIIMFAESKGTDATRAQEVADVVWRAVAEFGQYQELAAIAYVGGLGAKAIKSIGWKYLCEAETSQGAFIKSQIRECAKAIIEREKNGIADQIFDGKSQIAHMSAGLKSLE